MKKIKDNSLNQTIIKRDLGEIDQFCQVLKQSRIEPLRIYYLKTKLLKTRITLLNVHLLFNINVNTQISLRIIIMIIMTQQKIYLNSISKKKSHCNPKNKMKINKFTRRIDLAVN